MRYLGIDYGSKRVGMALSDEAGQMAFPHQTLPNDESLLATVAKLAAEEKVAKIVVGHSVDKDGQDNPVHDSVKAFITDLTLETGLPIELETELYTTKEAGRIQGFGKNIDASAAAIILNSYLSKNHSQPKHD